MKISKIISASALSFSLLLAGCGSKEVGKTGEKKEKNSLTVYTTIYPLEDFTKKIGGSYVKLKVSILQM